MKKKIIVNGEEVEYFHIQENLDGTTEITFSKTFDIVTAHMSEIMKRVRDNGLRCQVFKGDIDKGFITIILYDMNDLAGVLYSLDIPLTAYEVIDEEFKTIIVDINKLPNHTPNLRGDIAATGVI